MNKHKLTGLLRQQSANQGVGYLDDGTMIVIEGGRDHLNESVRISVTSVLQTTAGKMIFGRYEERRDRADRSDRPDRSDRTEKRQPNGVHAK